MANKHLRLDPHKISDNVWWYELPKGAGIYVRPTHGETITILLPWRQLKGALDRKQKKDVRKG